jgi:hypothetical protein
MTTPFRRRHHDDESAHDRARALTAIEMLEPLDELQTVWLTGHLEGCAECRTDREAYLADRSLLRGLREQAPEPPRDLRARTMAALDREALARSRRGRAAGRTVGGLTPRRRPSMPFGAAAGALIVVVVVGATVLPQMIQSIAPNKPGDSAIAFGSAEGQPTPFQVPATAVNDVGWIQPGRDGGWDLVLADVTSLCPRTRPSCQPLGEDQPSRRIDLGSKPHGVTISPTETQLVVETRAQGSTPGRIFVVSLPPEPPTPSVVPTAEATSSPASGPPVTAGPATPNPTEVAITPLPSTDVPRGAVEIATGVTVVGETLYSSNGDWLAFSARPSDGSHGPDLYLWHVGEPTAIAVTDDHATYFSTWFEDRILASHVDVAAPGASPAASPSADPTASPAIEGRPTSFLLDPATHARTPIAQPDVWLPVVDPSGTFVAYWSGTLRRNAGTEEWQPATGALVLAAWSDGTTPQPSASPEASANADATRAPLPLGPAGEPTELVHGPVAAFRTNFDPTGSRLAVWVGDTIDGDVGRLNLVVLDPKTHGIDPAFTPLPGVPALRRFSIEKGRLAWVSPSGQDGQDSAVQVLGWAGNEFGEMRAIPAKQMYLVR